jgi:hypothetical protein
MSKANIYFWSFFVFFLNDIFLYNNDNFFKQGCDFYFQKMLKAQLFCPINVQLLSSFVV